MAMTIRGALTAPPEPPWQSLALRPAKGLPSGAFACLRTLRIGSANAGSLYESGERVGQGCQ